jgi:hypothetical protein
MLVETNTCSVRFYSKKSFSVDKKGKHAIIETNFLRPAGNQHNVPLSSHLGTQTLQQRRHLS